ncbi:L-iditol 2-dehydrogenase [Amycolatopsis bartoniae]|uniref:Sorbitol dehydrogenase n=1 Tax=Amycolatopsis bartoniae TaxID=941986 RepID=A0A8H9MEW8_9PSEU|nr:alcohol dehydrogenase catalytic domain-containing protein [Amycolatopsis bartoniae]MBB2935579.1 L-iditol 2-dehydrogenase [Amycolatopsis bartoniae]TVT05236.1 zinc-binding dehydrogenase [Amycolatopsis bartoniae]GHF76852.1 sorbitol dehydrogenase [Amycolatopsis bartoniae]
MTQDKAVLLHGARDLRAGRVPRGEAGPGQVRVAVRGVGLCGSDLHYFADGRNGTNVVRAPTVLGHEGFGVITETGPGVPGDRLGERVAIEPAAPCLRCAACLSGRYNVCPNHTCLGSPPTHGLLRESALVPAQFAHPLPDSVPDEVASLIEPLAVATWALDRGAPVAGRRVLVTGAGPIGLLVLQAARAHGAAEVVVTDLSPERLRAAAALGATTGEGPFDVAFDCSGAPPAIRSAASALAPGGTLVLVGVPGEPEPAFPLQLVQRYEFDIRGCFRYGPGAFATAIAWAADGRVDLAALVTSRFSLDETAAALEAALTDRSQLKVVIDL